jgi:mono/diheme cytochrome c family protein
MARPDEGATRLARVRARRRGAPTRIGILRRRAGQVCLLAAALVLSACAVQTLEFENTRAARELARQTEPPGSIRLGWRVYQQRCAACHGAAAEGAANVPDLTQRLRELGPHQFVGLVLRRYDPLLGVGAGAPSEALVGEVVARRRGALSMPAWQGEPVVSAHVMDLYAYLVARSEGRVGPGAP